MTENKELYQVSRTRWFGKSELELMQKMFERAPVAIAVLEGPDHRIKYMNQHLRDLFGGRTFTRGTPVKEFWTELEDLYMEEAKANRLNILNKVYATGEPFVANEFKAYTDRNYDGVLEEGHFNFIYQPLKDIDGEVYGIFISGYEVTEQVKTSRERAQYEQRLKFALESGRIGYWEFSVEDTTLYYISDLCKVHFGHPPEEPFTHKDFVKAIHPEDSSYVTNKIEESMQKPGFYEVEYRVRWPDGSLHWLLSRGHNLRDEQGHPYRMVGVTMDITRQKETEYKLKEAVQVRDDFLSVAAHELQTPVTSIKARAELFERQLRDAGQDAWAGRAEKINERIDQLSQLTGSLLDISRIREGKFTLNKHVFPLDELIEETVETLKHVSHHAIEIQGETQASVCADRYRIGQVLTNLLENAIKYSPEAGRILVHISEENGYVDVSVIDFGIGISEADKQKVFERFYKGREGGKDTYPGFGIGLFISAQIVERHNGTIRVEDNNRQGSVFTFTLPTADL